jgi:hypothetical protein
MLPLHLVFLIAVCCGTVAGYMLMEHSPRFRSCVIRALRIDRRGR